MKRRDVLRLALNPRLKRKNSFLGAIKSLEGEACYVAWGSNVVSCRYVLKGNCLKVTTFLNEVAFIDSDEVSSVMRLGSVAAEEADIELLENMYDENLKSSRYEEGGDDYSD